MLWALLNLIGILNIYYDYQLCVCANVCVPESVCVQCAFSLTLTSVWIDYSDLPPFLFSMPVCFLMREIKEKVWVCVVRDVGTVWEGLGEEKPWSEYIVYKKNLFSIKIKLYKKEYLTVNVTKFCRIFRAKLLYSVYNVLQWPGEFLCSVVSFIWCQSVFFI